VEVPDYDPSLYKCERLEATSHDGVKVPISLVYRSVSQSVSQAVSLSSDWAHIAPRVPPCRAHRKDCSSKPFKGLVLYGYGSYGHSVDPYFVSSRVTLLNKGVGFAIGHIRGGGEVRVLLRRLSVCFDSQQHPRLISYATDDSPLIVCRWGASGTRSTAST
jgi:oligopeptidase B